MTTSVRWLLGLMGLLAAMECDARILRTKIAPSQTWDPWLPFTFGSGVEFETHAEQRQLEFPILIEYNFSRTVKVSLEPDVVYLDSHGSQSRPVAFGDLETSLEYEFVSERRYRPGLTALGTIRWPTASDADVGSAGRDYSLGLIASKDLVFVDIDLSALYTFMGDPRERNSLEISGAAEWHLNHFFDIEAELVQSLGSGGIGGRPGSLSGIGMEKRGTNLTEATLGLAWRVTKRLKLEQGGVLRTDGTWQIVFAWEFSFAGD